MEIREREREAGGGGGGVQDRCTHYSILPLVVSTPSGIPRDTRRYTEVILQLRSTSDLLISLAHIAEARLFKCFVFCAEIHLEAHPR